MRRTPLALALLALLAGCGGSESEEVLSRNGFRGAVTSALLSQTDLKAEPRFGLIVRVTEESGADWLRLDLEDPYARYRREPSRRAEIVAEVVRTVRRRMEEGISQAPFEEVRPDLLPVLKPRFAVDDLGKPAERRFVAGLVVVYGVQREDQFTLVSAADAERWGRPLAELDRIALENLARETREHEALLCEEELCGWASGDGYDATRMIVPALRREIVEEIGPAVYAVPREDVFVALPIRLAQQIRTKVLRDFTTAPNPISPEIFVERNGRLVPLEA